MYIFQQSPPPPPPLLEVWNFFMHYLQILMAPPPPQKWNSYGKKNQKASKNTKPLSQPTAHNRLENTNTNPQQLNLKLIQTHWNTSNNHNPPQFTVEIQQTTTIHWNPAKPETHKPAATTKIHHQPHKLSQTRYPHRT